jgi:hypothetical protein
MASGRNVFLTRALEKILSEKEIKRSQHTKLRSSCERTLSKYVYTAQAHTHMQTGLCEYADYVVAMD